MNRYRRASNAALRNLEHARKCDCGNYWTCNAGGKCLHCIDGRPDIKPKTVKYTSQPREYRLAIEDLRQQH